MAIINNRKKYPMIYKEQITSFDRYVKRRKKCMKLPIFVINTGALKIIVHRIQVLRYKFYMICLQLYEPENVFCDF